MSELMQNRRGFFAACLAALPIPFLPKKPKPTLLMFKGKEIITVPMLTERSLIMIKKTKGQSGYQIVWVFSRG